MIARARRLRRLIPWLGLSRRQRELVLLYAGDADADRRPHPAGRPLRRELPSDDRRRW